MRKVLVLATASFLMTSCVIDKRELVSDVDQYNKEFVSVFGETDPNHTWCMVENKKVEVNLNKPSQVKVYVKAGQNYHLAADYENVSGKQQLSFDAPMGCEDVYVTVDGGPYQSVGSRTAINTENWKGVMSVGEDYREYTYAQIKGFKDDKETLPERVDNTKKVRMDYIAEAESDKTYTFYPLFWNAHFSHTFGLYYYVNGVKYELDFYEDKEGDCLQYYNSQSTSDNKWENVTDNYVFQTIFNQQFDDEDVVLRSKPYTIKFPEGTRQFGFYVNVYESKKGEGLVHRAKYYSNPALNEDKYKMSSFAYLVRDGNTYITIEDHNNDDFDYNDFIFVMEGTQSHIEETPLEYIYAVEDLGGSDDFDFNDVVFSVSHVSGQPHANVKLLAAGGTLPAYIYFGNTMCGGKEVHEMFGVDTKVMVNTKDGTTKENMKPGKNFVVSVPANWSHVPYRIDNSINPSVESVLDEIYFSVKVMKDGTAYEVTRRRPGTDAAPQILVLTPEWLWPTERTRINTAYPGFGEWGANYTNKTWVENVQGPVVNWLE